MSLADWREWLQFKPVDFDQQSKPSSEPPKQHTSSQNTGHRVWLNFFGWQRPQHWPMPKPNPNPIGWSDEALAVMDELEELFD